MDVTGNANKAIADTGEGLGEPSESVEEDADGGITSPNDGLHLPDESLPNGSPTSQSPSLKRSSTVRKPSARYGECISDPDCYSSSSESEVVFLQEGEQCNN